MIKATRRRKRMYPCPKCKGVGNLPCGIIGGHVPCPDCKGTGKVTTKPKDEIEVLYDSFKHKDMTLAEFRHRYTRATDPRRAQRDLNRMVQGQRLKREIDGKMQRL